MQSQISGVLKKAFLFPLLLLGFCISAQTEFKPHVSGFMMTSLTYRHNSRWSAYIELQTRSIEDYSHLDYYEMKGGPAYNFNKNNQVLIGFGRYGTYKDNKFSQREYRLWLQYVLSQNAGKVKLDHRARAEKRFFSYPQQNSVANDERFRYRLSATMPLSGDKITPGTFFVNAFEEVFFGPANPGSDIFKRNRTFAGFGYQISPLMNTNFGYMWQKEFVTGGNKNYHFVYFGLNFTINRTQEGHSGGIPVAD